MSIVKTTPDSQAPPNLPEFNEPRFTAEQIGKDCPAHLQEIGEEITKRLFQAQEQAKVLDDHVVELKKLVAEAAELCDDGGFRAFQKKFFPDLSKSRVYELLAIGTNKKSVDEIRAGTRARVAKFRANKTAAPNSVTKTDKSKSEPRTQVAPNDGEPEAPGIASGQVPPSSVTVTDKSKPEPCTQGAPGDGETQAPGIASEQTSEPSKPWSARAAEELMRVFTVHTTELQKRIDKRPPEHFSATNVSEAILEQLGSFFTKLANIKKSEAAQPAPTVVLVGNGQPAGIAEQAA